LLTRILSLTQHYLTSPTPTLRKSLLDLVSTVSPALAPDEDAFLPLVHTVWPVVLARLHDPEAFVCIAACKALGRLCEAAGDFLGSRFKTEWFGDLGRWARKVKMEAQGGKGKQKRTVVGGRIEIGGGGGGIMIPVRSGSSSGSGGVGNLGLGGGEGRMIKDGTGGIQVGKFKGETGEGAGNVSGLGRFAQANQVWEAVLDMLTCLVGNVSIEDEMFDEILELVVDALPKHRELREAMEVVNADAVWLALLETGVPYCGEEAVRLVVEEPVMDGWRFAKMVVGGVV